MTRYKLDLLTVGEDRFEVIRRLPLSMFKEQPTSEKVQEIKQAHGCDRVYFSRETQEYLLVVPLEEAIILEPILNDDL